MQNDPGIQIVYSGKIRLEACSACQLRCPSCPTTTGHTEAVVGKSYLRAADFISLIDDNPWIGIVELSNYGEVFLNPELLDIFRHAYERNVTLEIMNGANLNHVSDDVLEGLVRYGVGAITCSIDGASQDSYAHYRVRGKFDRVIANIKRINAFKKSHASAHPLMFWQFIAFGHNEQDISDARALAKELGMKFYVKLNWDADFSPVENKDLIRDATRGGVATREEYFEKTGRDYLENICADLWKNPQVNWDGKILGCCRNFWGEFAGNAFRDGLIDSLNHEKMRYARAMLEGTAEPRDDIPCTTCSLYKTRRAAKDWFKARPPITKSTAPAAAAEAWRKAVLSHSAGKFDNTAAWSRVVLQIDPHHREALSVLGDVAESAGRSEAAQYYRTKAALAANA